MQDKANKYHVHLRPHTKTHKMPRIAQMQMEAGAVGITTAQIGEAAGELAPAGGHGGRKSALLTAIKTVHTALYAVMVTAIFYVIYCGITGTRDWLLAGSVGLVVLEGIIFFGNGRKCPLTVLAQKYGDPKGYVGDLFCPQWLARRTFVIFTSLFAVGVVLVAIRLISGW